MTSQLLEQESVLQNSSTAQNAEHQAIDFVPNPEFIDHTLEQSSIVDELLSGAKVSSAPLDMPAHLRRMCESDLLTKEQEQALFREMNYLKYQTNQISCTDNYDQEEVQLLLERANLIRDRIITANMRLVISIVKKYVTPQVSFDELLSEGGMTLMQAVEKYDYSKGFRFSTYAYRSVTRKVYRVLETAQRDRTRFCPDSDEITSEEEDYRFVSTVQDRLWGTLHDLLPSLMEKLDQREQYIINNRYALADTHISSTFQKMADELNVSKERVRQLEQRAVKKLKKLVSELELDEFLTVGFC